MQIRGALSTGNINLGTRHGAVKSTHKRMGKVKGLDRFMGTMETAKTDLMETSSGEAKYEHQHKSIVWRVARLPKHGQGSYTTHEFLCKFVLTDYDKENLPDMSKFEVCSKCFHFVCQHAFNFRNTSTLSSPSRQPTSLTRFSDPCRSSTGLVSLPRRR